MPVRRRDGPIARLGDEGGFALPLALSILAILSLLIVATVGFATHNTDRANRDRQAVRALAAADAGVEAAIYRMNKALFSSQVQGTLGVLPAAVAETQCISLNLGSLSLVNPVGGWCPASTGTEAVDGPAAAGQDWRAGSFSYTVSTGINIGPVPGNPDAGLIERRVVSVGTNGDVTKRVMATIHAWIGSPSGTLSGNLLRVFEQVGYIECTTDTPPPNDPAAGC